MNFQNEPSADDIALAREQNLALERGDKTEAQRIFDRRMGNGAAAEGLPPALGPNDSPPALPAERQDAAVEEMRSYGADGEAIVREWGSDFGQNVGYARYAYENINPKLIAAFDSALESADDPGALMASAVKYLSQTGRMLAHRQGTDVVPVSEPTPSRASPPASERITSNTGDIHSLTRKKNLALEAGRSAEAHALNRQIQALAARIGGNRPIVGRGGRTI